MDRHAQEGGDDQRHLIKSESAHALIALDFVDINSMVRVSRINSNCFAYSAAMTCLTKGCVCVAPVSLGVVD